MGRKRKEPGEKSVAFSFSTSDPEVVAFLKGLPSQGVRSYLITQLLKLYIQSQNGQGVLPELSINKPIQIQKAEIKQESKVETVEPVKQYIEPVREVVTKPMQEAKQSLNQEVDLLEEFGGLL